MTPPDTSPIFYIDSSNDDDFQLLLDELNDTTKPKIVLLAQKIKQWFEKTFEKLGHLFSC
jgi:hypothetical protein